MAVNGVPMGTVLRLQLQTGTNQDGDPVLRNKTINNVKAGMDEAQLLELAQDLAQLQKHPLAAALKVDTVRLEETE